MKKAVDPIVDYLGRRDRYPFLFLRDARKVVGLELVEHRAVLTDQHRYAGRVEQIAALEELKRAASATQARIAAELVASQRAAQVVAGVRSGRAHRGVGEQVALARRESPHRGGTFVGVANALVHEMPHTMAALREGRVSELGATCLVRETAVLQVHDRVEVDARLAPMLADPGWARQR